MNDVSHEPSGGSFWLSVIGIVGCFLLFAVLVYVGYISRAPTENTPVFSAAELKELDALSPTEREARMADMRWEKKIPTPADRKARLTELRNKEAQALSTYSWVDREKGIVRLPIDRAIELTVQDLRRKNAGAGTP